MSETGAWIIAEENEAPLDGSAEIESREPDPLETEGSETLSELAERLDPERLLHLLKRSRRLLIGLAFLGGFIIGWIIIGRWLWPANRNAEPWELRERHQVTYVSMVAQEYARTGDVIRAQRALDGWEDETLTDLMVEMAARASDPQERQRLTALAKALQLPDYQLSLVTYFLLNKSILLSFVLSASPLVAAVVVAVAPLLKREKQDGDSTASVELLPDDPEQLEEMLQQGLIELGPDGEYVPLDEGDGAVMYRDQVEQADDEGEEYAEGTAEPGEEELEEDLDDEEDWDEWDDDEEVETEGAVADILLDLFDDDEGSLAYLEALAKNLSQIDVEELLALAQNVAHRFQTETPRTTVKT